MSKYGIYYGSTTGTTREIAEKIAERLGVAPADVHDVADTAPDTVAAYDVLLLGSSTWGDGELQDDWPDFLHGLSALSLKGKKIAIFGVGDETNVDTFCNAVGLLYGALQNTGATFIGDYPDNAYHFDHTDAEVNGKVVGLLLDETNHPDLTDGRIDGWVAEIEKQTEN